MFTINELPDHMHLTGSLYPLGICVVTASCHHTLNVKSSLSFGSESVKALKANHLNDIYVDGKSIKKIHDILVKLQNKLSSMRELSKEEKAAYFLPYLNTLIEQYLDKAGASIIQYKFAALCLPVGISSEHSCSCGSDGAMGLVSLIDNQGMTHEY